MPPSIPAARRAGTASLTIQDVADRAGVSKATVSRFLNRGGEQLSADIEARVSAAVRELGYSPSPMAQALKRGKSKLIGLLALRRDALRISAELAAELV